VKRLLFAALILHTQWVLVVMDQCRRIVGFGVHRGIVDGVALCQMFNRRSARPQPPTRSGPVIPMSGPSDPNSPDPEACLCRAIDQIFNPA